MAYLCTSRAGWLTLADCFRISKSGTGNNVEDLECKVEQGNGDMRPSRTVGVQEVEKVRMRCLVLITCPSRRIVIRRTLDLLILRILLYFICWYIQQIRSRDDSS
ncbi:hypothetical protein TNCV_2757971 [Trichonephila clavipes]|nr:hypothetical protein TNCV_2757971 [Trichonephila clavipes]